MMPDQAGMNNDGLVVVHVGVLTFGQHLELELGDRTGWAQQEEAERGRKRQEEGGRGRKR